MEAQRNGGGKGTEPEGKNPRQRGESFGGILTKAVACFAALFLGYAMYHVFFVDIPKTLVLETVIQQHFLALTGVPLSAIAATLVLAMFRAEAGEIKFKAIGFEFEGASGPAVIWVLCFLAFVVALRVLWLPAEKGL